MMTTVAAMTKAMMFTMTKATVAESAMTEFAMTEPVVTEIVVRTFVIRRTLNASRVGRVVRDRRHALRELRRNLVRGHLRARGMSRQHSSASAASKGSTIERRCDRLITLDEVINEESRAAEPCDPVHGMKLLQSLNNLHQLPAFSRRRNAYPPSTRPLLKLLFEFLRHTSSSYLFAFSAQTRDT